MAAASSELATMRAVEGAEEEPRTGDNGFPDRREITDPTADRKSGV